MNTAGGFADSGESLIEYAKGCYRSDFDDGNRSWAGIDAAHSPRGRGHAGEPRRQSRRASAAGAGKERWRGEVEQRLAAMR